MRVRRETSNLDKYIARAKKASGGVAVGVLASGANKYPDGQSVATVAAYNEFGTRDIPERPAIRMGIAAHVSAFGFDRKKLARAVMRGNMRASAALSIMGVDARDSISDTIVNGMSPANAQTTIDQKGSATPLIDTGLYRQSLSFEVRK